MSTLTLDTHGCISNVNPICPTQKSDITHLLVLQFVSEAPMVSTASRSVSVDLVSHVTW